MLASPTSTSRALNPNARLVMYGQELNPESYAICKADMLIKGQDIANIIFGNTLSDRRPRRPDTSTTCSPIRRSAWSGRRSRRRSARKPNRGIQRPLRPWPAARQRRLAPVPPAPDLEDAPAKDGGQRVRHRAQRLAAVHRRRGLGRDRDSPLDHRERLVEAIIGSAQTSCSTTRASAPTSGSSTQRKPAERRGKVQLIDASTDFEKMRKSLGSKRKEISDETDRRGHPALRRVRGRREGQDLPE